MKLTQEFLDALFPFLIHVVLYKIISYIYYLALTC